MSAHASLTVESVLERAVRWCGGLEAVVDAHWRLTYREMDEASRRVAALLKSAGVGAGDTVALLTLPSSVHMVAWLGVVRAGALPMALHTRESGFNLAQACKRMAARLLIYDAALGNLVNELALHHPALLELIRVRSSVAETACSAVPLATIPDDLARHAPLEVVHVAGEDDPLVIILSSGTTAAPKGVVHTHRSMLEGARSLVSLYADLRPGSRIVIPLSTAFLGCYASWVPFFNVGACSVFVEKFELESLLDIMQRERVTHICLTPTMWRRLLQMSTERSTYRYIRQALFAAEPMDSTTLQNLRTHVTPAVAQSYGSSEVIGASCIWAEEMTDERILSVGRPYLNADIRIVAAGGGLQDLVRAGESGDVLVTAPSIAQGIWGDEMLTDKFFVHDGLRRWWRSGDIGHVDADGYLFLEGRSDDMIISGGIKIMPAAVEDILARHASVRECAVVGMPHAEWGQQVHAFVVSADPRLSAEALDLFVKQSELSAYSRPRAYHFVTSLPRTATNKLNRRALREVGVPR